ncbi:hypothetical protein SASPL_112834 [Salvia splendens]|uniref:Uncharacterized protein n=1 Tax=Salvia splendens TaxID=180675 RepID=A0A8X9A3N1_SALSN|nr:hypothetical protein SASPL_112834 [Salvia splendens]
MRWIPPKNLSYGSPLGGKLRSSTFELLVILCSPLQTVLQVWQVGGSIGQVPVLLAKPQTYMNFSGEAVPPPHYAC